MKKIKLENGIFPVQTCGECPVRVLDTPDGSYCVVKLATVKNEDLIDIAPFQNSFPPDCPLEDSKCTNKKYLFCNNCHDFKNCEAPEKVYALCPQCKKEPGNHRTAIGVLCHTCYDHYTKDDMDDMDDVRYSNEYEGEN